MLPEVSRGGSMKAQNFSPRINNNSLLSQDQAPAFPKPLDFSKKFEPVSDYTEAKTQ